jgi:hypothetical protein
MSPRGYCRSGHPEQCKNIFVHRQSEQNGKIFQRVECKRRALWLIADMKLRLCHTCFERYIAAHAELDMAQIVRLSDNERDFAEHLQSPAKGDSIYQ